MRPPPLSPEEVRRAVAHLPRLHLAHLPTPLEEAPRLAAHLGGPRLLVKRDDCTGLLFGGNKTRHNEFLLADAQKQGADVLVWGAGAQSNNCRQTAAACARLGLDCHLYLSRKTHHQEVQGNLLLDYLMGADVHHVDAPMGPELDALLHVKAAELRRAGRKPYVWDRETGRPLAAVSYVLCLAEIVEQLAARGMTAAAVYSCAAGATGAGLALGRVLLGLTGAVRLVLPIHWPWEVRADLAEVANRAAALLGLPHRLTAADVDATEDFVGEGYGTLTPAAWEALDLTARLEGVLLDPVYTAKAMAALVADVRARRYSAGDSIVFLHTGGQAAVFAYRNELVERLGLEGGK